MQKYSASVRQHR